MRVKVLKYHDTEEPKRCHLCKDKDGKEMYIDLMVSGDFHGQDPEFLVGKTVEIWRMHAYVSIADEVRICK